MTNNKMFLENVPGAVQSASFDADLILSPDPGF